MIVSCTWTGGSFFLSNGEEDWNMPLKDSTETTQRKFGSGWIEQTIKIRAFVHKICTKCRLIRRRGWCLFHFRWLVYRDYFCNFLVYPWIPRKAPGSNDKDIISGERGGPCFFRVRRGRGNASSRGPSTKRCSAEVWALWTSHYFSTRLIPGANLKYQKEVDRFFSFFKNCSSLLQIRLIHLMILYYNLVEEL
jgi:hypothetical protein